MLIRRLKNFSTPSIFSFRYRIATMDGLGFFADYLRGRAHPIVLKAFHLRNPIQSQTSKVACKRVQQATLVGIQLMKTTWVLSNLLVTLDDMVDGTVEG